MYLYISIYISMYTYIYMYIYINMCIYMCVCVETVPTRKLSGASSSDPASPPVCPS